MLLIEFEMMQEDAGQYVYHATTADKLGKIMQNGLTLFNTSNWVQAGNPDERYQDDPGVFAFEHPMDAYRWAFKMQWEFDTPAVVIKFNRGSSWEQDPSPDIHLQMGKGKALMSKEPIPASDFKGVVLIDRLGSPNENNMSGEEFDAHVEKTISEL